jgi:hypothetical protein
MSLCSCVWMFWFLSLQHQCDAAVGFIFHKNLAGFFRRMSLAQATLLVPKLKEACAAISEAITSHRRTSPVAALSEGV